MKNTLKISLWLLCCMLSFSAFSQKYNDDGGWPKVLKIKEGKITIFEPQPERLTGDILSFRSAISITLGKNDPVFGAIWSDAVLETNRTTRMSTITYIRIEDIRLPDVQNQESINYYKGIIETELPALHLDISMDRIVASLEQAPDHENNGFDNRPPKIIYETHPSLLVTIDGDPILQKGQEFGVERVVNTPFVILKQNNRYYLYASKQFFSSADLRGPWSLQKKVSKELENVGRILEASDKNNDEIMDVPSENINIIVSFEPAEIIQTDGEAKLQAIPNSSLLFVSNTEDNIFMNINDQRYYVLISGRWFSSNNLSGNQWTYIPADQLPSDFTQIPEGSEKDIVLASIPETNAAREAIADAMIPETAKVSRATATTTIEYDGDPHYERISGTELDYVPNASSIVLREYNTYYTVDNGVWFTASSPRGPWIVAIQRPRSVERIPASSPAYNVRFVYIYNITPEYVYMGYLPGYMNSYVYNGCIIYGTGYRYKPWFRTRYYARPATWGYNWYYNPWTGWSLGIGVNTGYWHFGFWHRWHHSSSYHCGHWGPARYRPSFYFPHSHYYGTGRPVIIQPRNSIHISRQPRYTANRPATSIYANRRDIQVRSNNPGGISRATAGNRRTNMNTRTNNYPSERSGITTGTSGRQPARTETTRRTNNNTQVTRPGTSTPTNRSQFTRTETTRRTNNTQVTRPAANNSQVQTPPVRTQRRSVATERPKEPNNVSVDRSGNITRETRPGQVETRKSNTWTPPASSSDSNRRQSTQVNRERGAERTSTFQRSQNSSVTPQRTSPATNKSKSTSSTRSTRENSSRRR